MERRGHQHEAKKPKGGMAVEEAGKMGGEIRKERLGPSGRAGEGQGSGHRGPAPGHVFGVASVTQALAGVSFPISKRELMRKHGKAEVHWTKDSRERLSDILQRVPQDEFQSAAEVAAAVSETHRETG